MNESRDILRRALDLNLAVYRVTDRLPVGEVLIWQLRELANGIGGDLTVGENLIAINKIEKILFYFEIAFQQNWVNQKNWIVLKDEYLLLKQELTSINKENRGGEETQKIVSHNIEEGKEEKPELSVRQKGIMDLLKGKDYVKSSDIFPIFNTSSRSMLRDLHLLMRLGLIKKIGRNREIAYSLITNNIKK